VLSRHGGTLDAIGHPTTTLEDYFLHIVEESKAHPGRRYLPGKEPAPRLAAAPAPPVAPGSEQIQTDAK
jgi:ABC-2 type transport system ATP-binding protein